MKRGPFPCGRLSRPRNTTTRSDCRSTTRALPGSTGYRPGIAYRHPAGDGAETALPSSQDDHPHVQRPIRRRVPQRPLLDREGFPWPSPWSNRLSTLSPHPKAGPLDDACSGFTRAADHTVDPARFAPSLSTTHGSSLPGTHASPRTGLTPAGHPELDAPTSCGPPLPQCAGAVSAH